ncbi:N-acetyltransferase [Enterococcus florum]|uniref:N-acetyltransferase n=1 Tax=Enterococcus florum TaxID=2480627 RepID=A0A4P5P6L4_9ENTE|nr:GNAT family N-acetyltransferase [Enterococcus florum]GCF93400.1 N-acetyltransferase [Enterococcus florum]
MIHLLSEKTALPWELLMLADPEKEKIEAYVYDSKVLVYEWRNEIVGVLVFKMIDEETVEIMNMAVSERMQRQGIADRLMERFLEEVHRQPAVKAGIVRTGEIPEGPMRLYQKHGFEVSERRKNYFVDYCAEPIFEGDQQLKDQIIMKRFF